MSRKKEVLNLYVWEDVLTDYTSGMVVAIAYSLEEAQETLDSSVRFSLENSGDLNKPDIIELSPGRAAASWHCWGGG
jgi:hypothetical protein